MDSSHPPSHPDLLMWLAREFETHGYDIRRLIRMLVLTQTYQRSSAWDGPGPAPQPGTFARALEKPLSAEALFRSLQVASGNGADETGKYAGWDEHAGTFMRLYPDLFAEEYSPRLHQALFLANNKVIEDMFAPREGNTTQRLLETPGLRRRVKLAFETVLGREPDVTELRAALQFLGAREAEVGIRQFLWAMATSAEFMLNH